MIFSKLSKNLKIYQMTLSFLDAVSLYLVYHTEVGLKATTEALEKYENQTISTESLFFQQNVI